MFYNLRPLKILIWVNKDVTKQFCSFPYKLVAEAQMRANSYLDKQVFVSITWQELINIFWPHASLSRSLVIILMGL